MEDYKFVQVCDSQDLASFIRYLVACRRSQRGAIGKWMPSIIFYSCQHVRCIHHFCSTPHNSLYTCKERIIFDSILFGAVVYIWWRSNRQKQSKRRSAIFKE